MALKLQGQSCNIVPGNDHHTDVKINQLQMDIEAHYILYFDRVTFPMPGILCHHEIFKLLIKMGIYLHMNEEKKKISGQRKSNLVSVGFPCTQVYSTTARPSYDELTYYFNSKY